MDVQPSANYPDPDVLVYGQYEYGSQQVTLFADAFSSPADVDETLNHEILGHYLMDRLPDGPEALLKTQILLDAILPGSTLSPELREVRYNYGPETLLDPDALADEIWAHFVEDDANWQGQNGYFARIEQAIVDDWVNSDDYAAAQQASPVDLNASRNGGAGARVILSPSALIDAIASLSAAVRAPLSEMLGTASALALRSEQVLAPVA